jgi:translation elongation factor EF-G
MSTLNLGILAHVDAGKTSLTERLLFAAGVIDEVGSVDEGSTQTDLMRALQRLHIPTLIFANKVDRGGARYAPLLQSISNKLASAIIPMGSASGLGTRSVVCAPYGAADADFTSRLVDLLADHDDAFLTAYIDDAAMVSYRQLRGELAAQTKRALVHPVFFGSAITGAGVDALIAGIKELLPRPKAMPMARFRAQSSRSSEVRPGRRSRMFVCSREQYERGIGCDSGWIRRACWRVRFRRPGCTSCSNSCRR